MGSEMCIRDRRWGALRSGSLDRVDLLESTDPEDSMPDPRRSTLPGPAVDDACLLYTSDAADERSSVDLGGRRLIQKKNKKKKRKKQHC